MSAPTVAVIGGGQLARMMQEEASALGIHLRALVEAPDGSTALVTVDSPVGAADDAGAVAALAAGAGALTFEHEHQDDALLRALAAEGVRVRPSPDALLLARDKIAMRRAMDAAGLPQPAWTAASGNAASIRATIRGFAAEHGWPVILKTPRGGYDGHGVLLVRQERDLEAGRAGQWIDAVAAGGATGGGGSLGGGAVTSLLVEQAIPFTRELAALQARSPSGQVASWPIVETIQADGMCSEALAPAPGLDPAAADEAVRIGREIAERFDVTGVLAVELFAVEAFGEPTRLFVNELAMRPHNSGHWTQEGAVTSQFAQHLRAVLDLPLGSTEPTAGACVMVNLIGGRHEPGEDALARAMAADPEARIHLYGKSWRTGRKLGHVNLTGPADDVEGLRERARTVVAILRGDA
ncbi:5-(carboxyamino)imidazole ribonucleotide synthase [Actinomyces gaoshouyii]|uniref:5-(carboxyamino)imidazole ribonucleotide synthase n=1 Tax=Actinomyces gaoshouyii TaxID=1960083 RepID=UPI0009BC9CC1|nr:5-(carboxyamino)imidazole ribonucleotide synthase [Actinomyces gaoshouyii]ARD42815.1 5-(carboxyamino)imidazole ribonucleotide synthase [Actinomyces gaoshouyii]